MWIRNITAPSMPALSGAVYDDSGSSDLYVIMQTPGGALTSTLATRDGDSWSYRLNSTNEGDYVLRIEARDAEGNVSGYGPYNVSVGVKTVYLPLVIRNH